MRIVHATYAYDYVQEDDRKSKCWLRSTDEVLYVQLVSISVIHYCWHAYLQPANVQIWQDTRVFVET